MRSASKLLKKLVIKRATAVTLVTAMMTLGASWAYSQDDAYRQPGEQDGYNDSYYPDAPRNPNDGYRPRGDDRPYRNESRSNQDGPRNYDRQYDDAPPSRTATPSDPGGYGEPYANPDGNEPYERYERLPPRADGEYEGPEQRGTYTQGEIVRAGHNFFGSISQGLASGVEWAFQRAGEPNGYILGQDAGGAVIAGVRYGEGILYTKDAGTHKVFWQGPSVGYDLGAEGSKTMVLVYNMSDPSEIYRRFTGIEGAAYLVGGVSVQLQRAGHVTLSPIRAGVGVRLGANIGYLKYTRRPTWNPF